MHGELVGQIVNDGFLLVQFANELFANVVIFALKAIVLLLRRVGLNVQLVVLVQQLSVKRTPILNRF